MQSYGSLCRPPAWLGHGFGKPRSWQAGLMRTLAFRSVCQGMWKDNVVWSQGKPRPGRWPCMMEGKFTQGGWESQFLNPEIIPVRHWGVPILRMIRGAVGPTLTPPKPMTSIWLSDMSRLMIQPTSPPPGRFLGLPH